MDWLREVSVVGFWGSRLMLGMILTAGLWFESPSAERLYGVLALALGLLALNALTLPGKLAGPGIYAELALASGLEAVSQYAVNPFFALIYIALIFERAYGQRLVVSVAAVPGAGSWCWGVRRSPSWPAAGRLSTAWIAAMTLAAGLKYLEILRRDASFFDLGTAVLFLALLAAVAVALRFGQVYREERDELARLSGQVAALSAEKAQKRISQELHDTLGHALTAHIMRLELADHYLEDALTGQGPSAEAGSGFEWSDGDKGLKAQAAKAQIASAKEEGRTMLRTVQEIVTTLRDQAWTRGDFEALVSKAALWGQPEVSLVIEGELAWVSAGACHVLYRALQEGLTNVRRHSSAERVEARLVLTPGGGAELTVEDDGRVMGPLVPGNGLRGMRERVEALGGSLDCCVSERTGGLRLQVRLPEA